MQMATGSLGACQSDLDPNVPGYYGYHGLETECERERWREREKEREREGLLQGMGGEKKV